jgi:hypothetical protein
MIKEIEDEIRSSEAVLEANGTNYLEVLKGKDCEEYSELSEVNSFEAGRISGLKFALALIESVGLKDE